MNNDEALSIHSIEEFVYHGGKPENYRGRAVYGWTDGELIKWGDHPIVLSKKLRLQESKERLASLQCEIWAMEKAIYIFEKGLSNEI